MKKLQWAMVLVAVALFGCGGQPPGAGPSTGTEKSEIYTPTTRTYYVAADEVPWDYAPSGINQITGQPFDDVAKVFVERGDLRIGRVYKKALYREYTDATFKRLKPVLGKWKHLGVLGPAIRAVVGDKVVIVFKNNTRNPTSVHVHGLQYAKNAEGAGYDDGTSGTDKMDDAVQPGQIWVYSYDVPARAGPGPMDPSSVMWMYHSHVDEVADTNAGLMGPIIVTAAGSANADGSPKDVDREFVVNFSVMNENNSWLLDDNIQTYTGTPSAVVPDDPDFQESNLMHSMNGYVFGNLPGLEMRVGDRVRWYLMAMGTEVDLHTPHFHGQTVVVNGMRTDVTELLPASMKTADMTADNVGKWLFHCHVNDHIRAGMMATYVVKP